MQKIIRRGTGETEVIETNGNMSEEEKTEIFKSIDIKTEKLGRIMLVCTLCKNEGTFGRGIKVNITCVKCGSKDFISHSNFSMFCESCSQKRVVKEDEMFNTSHCQDRLWLTS